MAEDDPWRWYKKGSHTAKDIFGKLRKRNKCLIVRTPDEQEIALPLQCKISEKTAVELGLVSYWNTEAFRVVCTLRNLIDRDPPVKNEIPTV